MGYNFDNSSPYNSAFAKATALLIQFSLVSIHWHVFPGTTKDIVMSASASSSRVKLHKRCEDFRRLEGDQSFPLLLCVFWLQQHNDEIYSNFYPLLSKSMVNVYPSVLFLHTITMLVHILYGLVKLDN